MRKLHPLFRGTMLGLAWTVTALLLQGPDFLLAWQLEKSSLLLLGMTLLGALLAALPGFLRHRERVTVEWNLQSCLISVGCGVGMMLGLAAAGSGRILSALMEGSTGAFGFLLSAWIAGLVTTRLLGRRNA